MPTAECIADTRGSLGESPLWDPETRHLFWVDINRRLIHRLDPDTGGITDWSCKTEPGCLGRADNGRLIAGLRDGFYFFSPATGAFEHITDPEPAKPANRLNDGKVDRAGRFWAGTMKDDGGPPAPAGDRIGAGQHGDDVVTGGFDQPSQGGQGRFRRAGEDETHRASLGRLIAVSGSTPSRWSRSAVRPAATGWW